MRQSVDLARIKSRLPAAFKATKHERKGDDLLQFHFEELGLLPQASEVIAHQIALSAVDEVARVLAHLRESYEQSSVEQGEQNWDTVAHAVTYAAMWKSWRALNEAFNAARREDA